MGADDVAKMMLAAKVKQKSRPTPYSPMSPVRVEGAMSSRTGPITSTSRIPGRPRSACRKAAG